MATTVLLGAAEYIIEELSFYALELAWPYIEQALFINVVTDPLKGPSSALSVIAASLVADEDKFNPADFLIPEDHSKDPHRLIEAVSAFFKRRIKATEIQGIREALISIVREAGLLPEGDADAEVLGESVVDLLARVRASLGIPDDISLNSLLQDAREEAGTE